MGMPCLKIIVLHFRRHPTAAAAEAPWHRSFAYKLVNWVLNLYKGLYKQASAECCKAIKVTTRWRNSAGFKTRIGGIPRYSATKQHVEKCSRWGSQTAASELTDRAIISMEGKGWKCWYGIRLTWHNEELNLLQPADHVMHQQFNIQQLYVLLTLYLCVLYLSENKQRLVSLTA